jgi:hypothetical protein
MRDFIIADRANLAAAPEKPGLVSCLKNGPTPGGMMVTNAASIRSLMILLIVAL